MPTCLEFFGGDLKLRLQKSACISGFYGVHTYSGQQSDLAAFSAGCIIVHLPTYLVLQTNALTG